MQAGGKDDHYVEKEKVRIREAFGLFDKDKKGVVAPEEVPTIMRYLAIYPTEKALQKEILPELQEDEPTAAIPYERFEAKALELLNSKEWAPDMDDMLLQAFRTLAEEADRTGGGGGRDGGLGLGLGLGGSSGMGVRTGYIEAARMRELLMTRGTPFREKEVELFMSVAKDPDSQHICYEDYVALVSRDDI